MALTKVSSSLVSDNAVTSGKIADGGIATADIATNAITSTKIAQNSILTKHIDDGQVTTAQLGADAVTAAKIADDAISEEHLDVTVITGLTEVTAATGDLLMVADISDSNYLKKIPVSSILAGTLTNAAQTNITSLGTLTSLNVDTMTLNGSSITGTSNLTLDVAGDIILDADGGDIQLKDGGSVFGLLSNDNFTLKIQNHAQDTDIKLIGNDGGSLIDALTLDMSAAGAATFNSTIATGGGGASGKIAIAGNTATSEATHITFTNVQGAKAFAIGGGQSGVTNNGFVIRNVTDNTFPLVISDAGAATFAGNVTAGGEVRTTNINTASSTGTLTMYGGATNPGGKIVLSGGNNTGATGSGIVFHAGASTANPAERMRITSAGNVGIGTNNPAAKLDIVGGHLRLDAGMSLQWDNSHERIEQSDGHLEFFVNNGEVMTLDTNGLGIGTTAPIAKLTLPLEEANAFKIAFRAASGTGHAGISTVDQSGAGLFIGANAYVNASGSIIYGRSDHPSSGIYFDGWNADRMRFYTGASGNPTEKMTILSDGKVGIGTTAPGSKLELRTDTSSGGYGDYPALTIRNDNAAGYGAIHFNEGSTQRARVEVGNNSGNPYLGLYTGSGSSGITIKSGNVGIGTTAPSELLEVRKDSGNAIIKVQTGGGHDARLILDAPGASGAQSQIFFDDSGTTAGSIQYTHNSGGTDFMTFHSGGSNTERMRIHSNGHVSLGAVADLAFVRPVYRKNITISKTFTKLFNTNGAQLASGFVLNIHGTGSSVVVNAKFDVLVNHYQDIAISALGTFYTLCKIKVVTNGNEDATVYAAINSNNASSCTIEVEPLHNTTLEFSPSSVYSTNYFIHEASGGHTTGSAASMASGAGTTTGYS